MRADTLPARAGRRLKTTPGGLTAAKSAVADWETGRQC